MLNLKELERKLDEALAAETPESLTMWLLQERMGELSNFGEGRFEEMAPWRVSMALNFQAVESLYDWSEPIACIPSDNSDFSMAA